MTRPGIARTTSFSIQTQSSSGGRVSYSMKDEYSISRSSNGNSGKYRVNPFNLKQCDGESPDPENNDASTTRTEMSTDLDDCSGYASTSLYTASGGPSTSYASSFDSNAANFPSTTGRRPAQVDVITSSESYEIISQLTGPKEICHNNAYEHSLLDLDDDDACESPRQCPSPVESMFIGAIDANDTESRVNFYAPCVPKDGVATGAVRQRLNSMQSTGSMFIGNDGTADTESRVGFYKQSVSSRMGSNRRMSIETKHTDTRNDFNVVNDAEDPLSCRDKVEPVLSFTDEDEFDWLNQTTMKIEARKKEEKNNECGEYSSGVATNIRSFVARCGSCFSPQQV